MFSLRCCLLLLTGLLPAAIPMTSHAADWLRFRGADGRGVASSAAALEWSLDEGIVWKTDLPGQGSSSPIVVGDRVLLTCWSGSTAADASRWLVCMSAETGEQLWSDELPPGEREDPFDGFITEHGYSSSTPVSDGSNVYAFFGKAGVLACTLDGQRLWHQSVGQESSNRRWGSAASPVLFEDVLIVNAAEESRAVIGLSVADGSEVWRAEYDALELCFGTPVLAEGEGGVTEAVLALPGEVWGLNPRNGKLRWFCEVGTSGNVSPSVVVGKEAIYSFGGFPDTQSNAIRRGGRENISDTHRLWQSRDSTYVATPLLLGTQLFWVADRGQVYVMDATNGELIERRRLSQLKSGGRAVYASPVLAGGHVYVVSRRSGTYVFEAKSGFAQVAHNPPLDDSDFNATPAIVNGRIYLRSDQSLYCVAAPE